MLNTKIIARPWQPQDLIDDLQGIIDEECDNYLNTRRTTLCMARDYLKEHFAETKWISVKDRLPKENEFDWVLVVVEFHSQYGIFHSVPIVAELRHGEWYDSNDETIEGEFEKVTHWMPLPQPPKGE